MKVGLLTRPLRFPLTGIAGQVSNPAFNYCISIEDLLM